MLSELKKISKLSEKLKEYIKKVEEETGRPVSIKKAQYTGFNEICSVFKLDPKCIHVGIIEEGFCDSKGEINQEGMEYMIAHEATHGLLAYKKKYCQFKFVRRHNKLEENSVILLFSMIEDIVVSKIMHENNFQPYPYEYLDKIQTDTKHIRKSKGKFPQLHQDLALNDRIMILRYILAWGLLKYFNLDNYSKKIIYKLLKIFQKSYPQQYEEVKKIKAIILENDIFTPEGFYKTTKKCLALWNLTNLVEINTI